MAPENRLLAALLAPAFARVSPFLDVMPMTLKTVSHKPGDHVEHVYFPGGGFCSVEQRLARWLLMAHDRVERDEFPRECYGIATALLATVMAVGTSR